MRYDLDNPQGTRVGLGLAEQSQHLNALLQSQLPEGSMSLDPATLTQSSIYGMEFVAWPIH